jgi:hypothetical protein
MYIYVRAFYNKKFWEELTLEADFLTAQIYIAILAIRLY